MLLRSFHSALGCRCSHGLDHAIASHRRRDDDACAHLSHIIVTRTRSRDDGVLLSLVLLRTEERVDDVAIGREKNEARRIRAKPPNRVDSE